MGTVLCVAQCTIQKTKRTVLEGVKVDFGKGVQTREVFEKLNDSPTEMLFR
jgi:hypothetical protein